MLSKYCVSCHNEKVKSGGLALTTLDISAPRKNTEAWENVIRKVRTGAMPPVGRPRPDKATADSLVRVSRNRARPSRAGASRIRAVPRCSV